ncbi:MAG: outer membrane lipoprotein carrier protein LolA [Bacilli bacterium]|nr:outer membrane lipoprotein carrier protein LolA [Bacilli bacterium]
MKKILLVLFTCLFLSGCGNYSSKDAMKDLEKKINNLNSYKIEGQLEIKSNDDIYKYDVEASYQKDDKFRVSLKNQTNNHEQIILKNKDGVYVLTPSLNKSFKFQSDWPYNNSQTYLLQTLLSDIQNDSNRKYKETKNSYIFTTTVNYPNNTDLVKQKIYFDKSLTPKKVYVMNKDGDVLIKMTFKKVNLKSKFKEDHFEIEKNMQSAKVEEESKPVSKIDSDTYPMYLPENTKLANKETINLDEGQRVIMTFEGDSPFMFIQETASKSEDFNIISVYGEPTQLATSVAAISDNMVSWVFEGVAYYIVADNMSETELMDVASSVTTMPVSK